MLPFVSVIVITKNNAKTIEDCIVSLVNQTYPKENYEVIFVDGRSGDGTEEVIKKYMRTCQLLKLFYEDYGTMGYARNLGVRKSKGEIIAFTDGDAVLPENWIESIVNRFRENALVAVGGLDILISSSGSSRIIDSWRRLKKTVGIKAIPHIKTVNFAIRRDALVSCGGFDLRLSHLDEGELLARLYAKTKTNGILYDPEIVVYHKRAKSIAITGRIKKVFRKSVIGTPVLMRRYMAKVAIANPLSPIAIGLYLILVCVFGVPLSLLLIMLGLFTTLFVITVFLYIVALGVYMVDVFLKNRKVVASIPFVLTVDVIARLAGTFVGLVKWLRSLGKRD
jgi:glycosyltransferase involved in cell wall biosynthesis